ncbi:YkvA family protein [Sphingopyxis flava]
MPIGAKLIAGVAAACALSPIDLIPDFIPALGYVGELVLVSLGSWLAIGFIASKLMAEFRGRAEALSPLPSSGAGAYRHRDRYHLDSGDERHFVGVLAEAGRLSS